ncbi:peptide ABC transporter substrate-binding protein [Paenibacillus sp. M1]|uniref:Peptide ABC transporter substrate-binding protein n=1 Tax=Paenibacillus haidiansis TaxID=1574488 RepID=A0ABU7VPP5_9BACL
MKRRLVFMIAIAWLLSMTGVDTQTAFGSGGGQAFRMATTDLPESLNPREADTSMGKTIAKGLFEGLVRLDDDGKAVPAIAKEWKISDDGKVYTFTLRDDAKWSNNQPVTATDFEYAWKKALAPDTYAPYYYLMFPIANAELFSNGYITDASQVGVRALNNTTLQVTLTKKLVYFPQLLAEPIFFPVNAANASTNESWAYQASTMVTNGPFKIGNWNTHELILAKNDKYYNAKTVHWDQAKFIELIDAAAAFAKQEIDLFGSDYFLNDSLSDSDIQFSNPSLSYYYQFNTTEAPFDNLKIRKALAMAVKREQIDYGTPAFGFVPPGLHGVKSDFRSEVSDKTYFMEDINEARRLLKEGLAEEGLAKLPKFKIIVNDSLDNSHTDIANVVINNWKQNLGIEVEVEVQEWPELIDNRYQMNYQVARAGWAADYNDPAAFLEYFTSWSTDNDSGWSNENYDSYVKLASQTSDPALRNKLYANAEKLLIEQMVIIPLYYYSDYVVINPNLKDVFMDFDGSVEFVHGHFQ